jgi:uncharacterized membrane protein
MTPFVFWPYFAGLVCLIVGAWEARPEVSRARGLDKLVALGPLFLALPLAVFGAFHFVATNVVSKLVPAWMPWHLFWAYFVGVALLAAATSIALRRHVRLSSTLLGLMHFSFIVLLHAPAAARSPGNRLAWTILLREVAFAGGAWALAASYTPGENGKRLLLVARVFLATAAIFFGVEQILHPALVPAVPLARVTPEWVPLRLFWTFFTGAVMVIAGVAVLLGKRARAAATYMGTAVVAVLLCVYLPILVAFVGNIAQGLNYFADTLMFAGAVLLLARALPEKQGAVAKLRMTA